MLATPGADYAICANLDQRPVPNRPAKVQASKPDQRRPVKSFAPAISESHWSRRSGGRSCPARGRCSAAGHSPGEIAGLRPVSIDRIRSMHCLHFRFPQRPEFKQIVELGVDLRTRTETSRSPCLKPVSTGLNTRLATRTATTHKHALRRTRSLAKDPPGCSPTFAPSYPGRVLRRSLPFRVRQIVDNVDIRHPTAVAHLRPPVCEHRLLEASASSFLGVTMEEQRALQGRRPSSLSLHDRPSWRTSPSAAGSAVHAGA